MFPPKEKYAELYLKYGWSILPILRQSKKPLLEWKKFTKTKATIEEVRQWFVSWPDCEIGIITGKISGISVIDLDGAEGIEEAKRLKLWSPGTVLTGKGKHLYYKWKENIKNEVRIAPGIDIRSDNGYVLAPPSLHPNGKRYRWAGGYAIGAMHLPDFPILTGPVQHALKPVGTISHQGWVHEALQSLAPGNRNQTFTRIVGRLHSDGLDSSSIRSLLLPHANSCQFEELDQIIASVSRYERTKPISIKGCGIEEFLRDEEKVEWIVFGIIAKRSIGFVVGLPETQKTWLLIDLAVVAASSTGNWLDLFSVNPSKVLFIDQERFKGETQRRFKAVISGRGLEHSQLRDNLFIRCGTSTRLDLDDSFRAFREELLELRPDLVIVDTWATFHTRNDNDRQEVQKIIERVKQLRDEIGCAFIFIDHESKSVFQDAENKESPSAFRMVGSVGKSAAAEFVLTVRRYDPQTSTVYHTKSTLASTIPCFNTKVEDMEQGIVVKGIKE